MTTKHQIMTDAPLIEKFHTLREDACQSMNEYAAETMIVHQNEAVYPTLDKVSHAANNVYNEAMYQYKQPIYANRHKSKANRTYMSYSQINKLMKNWANSGENPLYRTMINVNLSQQVLRQVDSVIRIWFEVMKAYVKNPSSFTGRPGIPHYHKKQKRAFFVIDNQTAKLKPNGIIWIPCMKWRFQMQHRDVTKIQQITVTPISNVFIVHVVYKANQHQSYKRDNGKYLGIDPGLDNVLTLASNTKMKPVLINGKPLKSANQWYNKQKAYHQKCLAKNVKPNILAKFVPKTSRYIKQLSYHRYVYMSNYIHQLSNYVVQYAIKGECNTIIIGANKQQKRSINMGKRNNQNFVMIPHYKIVNAIRYKASLVGIPVLAVNESYTSQTSFLDDEKPVWLNGNNSRKQQGLSPINRRIHRGLFKSNHGQLINADVNGALQIIRKVNPVAFVKYKDQGLAVIGLWPEKVTL